MSAPVCRATVKESVPADPPNRFRWVDETYALVAGAWTYLYRAVDATGQTIDFM